MKTMRMVIGIISIVLFALIVFQSCAAGLVDAIEDEGGTSGSSGLIVAIIMLISGVVSIAARKSNGGAITAAIFYAIAGIIGVTSSGAFKDLLVWGIVSLVFAVLFIISVIVTKKKEPELVTAEGIKEPKIETAEGKKEPKIETAEGIFVGGLKVFICPKCKNKMELPTCNYCGYVVLQQNNIWQITDMPDFVTNGDGDKYIGYEHIGENYSGNRKYLIEERDALFAKEVSAITGNGVFLDLACGDGCFTVPCAANGTNIIAGDISNTMLSILQKKAQHNHILLENVTLCRMNALVIPLENESVDTVVANSMLHLISNPGKVVAEILRVLKKGGAFVCKDDRPGISGKSSFDNSKYNEVLSEICKNYYDTIIQKGIMPVKYSWKFDRSAICNSLFESKMEKLIKRGNIFEIPLKDGFLPRFCGRGFSDQVNIPQDLHNETIKKMLNKVKQKYGDNFADICFKGREDDLLITIYTK